MWNKLLHKCFPTAHELELFKSKINKTHWFLDAWVSLHSFIFPSLLIYNSPVILPTISHCHILINFGWIVANLALLRTNLRKKIITLVHIFLLILSINNNFLILFSIFYLVIYFQVTGWSMLIKVLLNFMYNTYFIYIISTNVTTNLHQTSHFHMFVTIN